MRRIGASRTSASASSATSERTPTGNPAAAEAAPGAVRDGRGPRGVVDGLYVYGHWEYARLNSRADKGRFLRGYLRFSEVQLRSGWIGAAATVLYVFTAVTLYGDWRADALRNGEGTMVEAHISGGGPLALLLMGSSARFVFLYDRTNARTVIVPDESLMSLTVTQPEPDPEPAPAPGA